MNLPYLLPRLVRHFLPERLTRFLLLRSLVIRPGLETTDPQAAVSRYVDLLNGRRQTLEGQRVLVFGYGGRFDIGIGLLESGAGHVVLCDKFAPPDEPHNAALLEKYPAHLFLDEYADGPRPKRMTLLQADIRDVHLADDFPPLDVVVSSSVYEHLDDVDGITRALASLTKPDGIQIHFVDLRDHFFKYPFEMLSYSEKTWYGWLNPTSHHNRSRLWDYRRVFEKYFDVIEIEVTARDEAAFEKARPRIRPEFISGNIQVDSVTLIRVLASKPRNK
ncbi:MAG: methyltransferase domain-containing protein [Chloroflexi bacterium]|nr:methyltransferase domain-containing protein [Chloroflexota bacterium]